MKIKKEQLETIKEQQEDSSRIIYDLGILEAQKHQLLHNLADLNKTIQDFKTELENEYGQVQINLEDGTYTPLEKQEEETPVAHV